MRIYRQSNKEAELLQASPLSAKLCFTRRFTTEQWKGRFWPQIFLDQTLL